MKLAAPTHNGEVLAVPDFAAIPALVEENRRRLDERFPEFRQLARRELNVDGPVIVTGHQPELFHPGVWVKNFAANGLAKKLNGSALNLIVDTDIVKSTSLRIPVLSNHPAKVRIESTPFDDSNGESVFETRSILNESLFQSFPERLQQITGNWPFRPLGWDVWRSRGATLSDRLIDIRRTVERSWGCENRELTVSRLTRFESFRHFVTHIIENAGGFRDAYNLAIRDYRSRHRLRSKNHPASELEAEELPFWTLQSGNRRRTLQHDPIRFEELRPKAMFLTLFARLILGDFFIHGLGGGKYDEVTDLIIRRFFQIEPPAFQILTATLHLPFSGNSSAAEPLIRNESKIRDLYWNPQRHLPESRRLVEVERHHSIVALDTDTRQQRRERFRLFRENAERLRPEVSFQVRLSEQSLQDARRETAANEILTRRDYAWVLYPEEQLRSFLQRFL